jgi:hypothetical protein
VGQGGNKQTLCKEERNALRKQSEGWNILLAAVNKKKFRVLDQSGRIGGAVEFVEFPDLNLTFDAQARNNVLAMWRPLRPPQLFAAHVVERGVSLKHKEGQRKSMIGVSTVSTQLIDGRFKWEQKLMNDLHRRSSSLYPTLGWYVGVPS